MGSSQDMCFWDTVNLCIQELMGPATSCSCPRASTLQEQQGALREPVFPSLLTGPFTWRFPFPQLVCLLFLIPREKCHLWQAWPRGGSGLVAVGPVGHTGGSGGGFSWAGVLHPV